MTFPRTNIDDADTEELTTKDLAEANRRVSTGIMEVGRPKPPRQSTEPATQGLNSSTPPAVAKAIALFPEDRRHELQGQWDDIQTGFVDDPRRAVQRADGLVEAAMQKLADEFSRERATLGQQWDHAENVSTEDLRLAFQGYRSFFRRLLSL